MLGSVTGKTISRITGTDVCKISFLVQTNPTPVSPIVHLIDLSLAQPAAHHDIDGMLNVGPVL
jgi:hypothetical protein